MIQKIIRAMIGIFGFVLGFTIYSSLASTFPVLLFGIEKGTILISAVVGLIIGVIFYIIGPWVIDRFKYIAKLMDKEISKYPPTIGIEFIKPPNKYAITNPIIRPIEPNNISV